MHHAGCGRHVRRAPRISAAPPGRRICRCAFRSRSRSIHAHQHCFPRRHRPRHDAQRISAAFFLSARHVCRALPQITRLRCRGSQNAQQRTPPRAARRRDAAARGRGRAAARAAERRADLAVARRRAPHGQPHQPHCEIRRSRRASRAAENIRRAQDISRRSTARSRISGPSKASSPRSLALVRWTRRPRPDPAAVPHRARRAAFRASRKSSPRRTR